MGRKRTLVCDLLFPHLAPAGIDRRVVCVGRKGVQDIARANLVQQILRIVRVEGILHRIEVIEIAKEFVEAVDGGQEFVPVSQVVLTELPGGVAQFFQGGRDGGRLGRHADLRAGLANRRQSGADRQFTGDEVGSAGRATRLRIVVRKDGTLTSEFVDVGGPSRHQATVIRADIPHADVIAHDEKNVGLRLGEGKAWGDCHQEGDQYCCQ